MLHQTSCGHKRVIFPLKASATAESLAEALFEIARTTGLFHALLGWAMLLFTVATIRGELQLPGAGRPLWGYVAAAALLFLGPRLAIAWFVGPELPTLGGALLGGLGFVALLRLKGAPPGTAGVGGAAVLRAAHPTRC